MKKHRNILALLVLLGISGVQAQVRTDTISLENAIQRSMTSNHQLLISQLEIQKALLQKKELGSNRLPQVEAYSSLSHFYAVPKMVIPGEIFGQTGKIPVELGTKYDWNSGLRFSQLIYNQSYFTSLKLVSELLSLQDLSYQKLTEEIVYQTTTVFHHCITIEQQISVFDSTIQNMERLQEIVQAQYENGIVRKADVERVAIDISKLEIEKLRMNESYAQQLNLLKILTGTDPDRPVYPVAEYPPKASLLRSSPEDVRNSIELSLLDKQKSARQMELKMEKQSNWPVLTAYGQHYYQGMRDQFDFLDGGDDRFFESGMIGIQLQVPIFNGFVKQSRIHLKEAELKQVHLKREQVMMNLTAGYSEAIQRYHNSLSTLDMEQNNLEAAKTIYETNLAGYKQQVVSLTDLILSEYQLTKTRMELYSAQFAVQQAELTVRKISGTLIIP